jgi:hypothetical protein
MTEPARTTPAEWLDPDPQACRLLWLVVLDGALRDLARGIDRLWPCSADAALVADLAGVDPLALRRLAASASQAPSRATYRPRKPK